LVGLRQVGFLVIHFDGAPGDDLDAILVRQQHHRAGTTPGRNHQLLAEVALLKEELRIKDSRLRRIPASQRPHYAPIERLAILALKASRAWSQAQAARAFLVTDATIGSWLARVDEQGPDALLKLPLPVNRFPDFVAALVRELKTLCPTLGRRRIAQTLAKAGLHVAPTTIRRMLQCDTTTPPSKPTPRAPTAPSDVRVKPDSTQPSSDSTKPSATTSRTVTAKYPHHVWNLDLTFVPTALGLWLPWLPFAMLQRWPFCHCVLGIVDHFSRKCLLAKSFPNAPTTLQVTDTLEVTIVITGQAPRYLVSDRGAQFREQYELWCRSTRIQPRFGAIGKHGSIALTERFILSLKTECISRIVVPLGFERFQTELLNYVFWYNEHRPHQSLDGRTPNEVCAGAKLPRDGPMYELRPGMRASDSSFKRVTNLRLVVSHFQNQPHLPIVSLQNAA
jgi:putative transposase